jgi:L-2,4-diaminobutyrate decarboxylase
VLAAMGERGLEAYIDGRFALTAKIYEYLQTLPGIECPIRPQANILCFRVTGSDALQLEIRNRLIATGDFYLSTAEINGRRYLRIVLMNPETSLSDIHRLLKTIKTATARPEL